MSTIKTDIVPLHELLMAYYFKSVTKSRHRIREISVINMLSHDSDDDFYSYGREYDTDTMLLGHVHNSNK